MSSPHSLWVHGFSPGLHPKKVFFFFFGRQPTLEQQYDKIFLDSWCFIFQHLETTAGKKGVLPGSLHPFSPNCLGEVDYDRKGTSLPQNGGLDQYKVLESEPLVASGKKHFDDLVPLLLEVTRNQNRKQVLQTVQTQLWYNST